MTADPTVDRLGAVPVDGRSTLSLELEDRHANFLGGTHGAVVYSLAEAALRAAAADGGRGFRVVDTHLALTGSSRPGDTLTARAEETTRGRTLGTYRVTVARSDGRLVGLLTGVVRFE